MKKLSLQWRITLMTALLICSTCMAMNWLIGCSGRHYMDSIGANLSTAIDPSEGAVEYFDPSREGLDPNLTIVIYGAQNSFTATNWYITAAVTLLGGILAYFVSGRALRPLRNSGSSATPSTRCWSGWTRASQPNGNSPETPPMSCAHRWR